MILHCTWLKLFLTVLRNLFEIKISKCAIYDGELQMAKQLFLIILVLNSDAIKNISPKNMTLKVI